MLRVKRLLPLVLLAACDGVADPAELIATPNTVKFESIRQTVTPSLVYTGTSLAGSTGEIVRWETSDPNVAIVNSSGAIVATGNGQAVITATKLRRRATIDVTVAQVPVAITAGPVLPNTPLTGLRVGQTLQGFASATDREGQLIVNAPVVWSSLSPDVLSVSATGQIRALGSGQGIVLARLGALSTQLTYNVQ